MDTEVMGVPKAVALEQAVFLGLLRYGAVSVLGSATQ